MEIFDIDYLKKNIPLSRKREHKIELIAKVESVIKRIRWKSLQFFDKLRRRQMGTF